jgi:acyl-coenzyme A synthetase/AMP-(fatty) acid ligase
VNTRAYRPIPLALTTLIALFAALAALAVSGGHDAAAHDNSGHQATAHTTATATASLSAKELALRLEMRRLWHEHTEWTRLAIVSLTTDAPDTEATVARLLRNQTDIGNAIKPFYGAAAGNRLTTLLREHIAIAADLIAAARKGDQPATASQQARWNDNADRIAALLASANPHAWKPAATKAMMRAHLRLTTDEVVARLQSRWADEVRTYDRVERQIRQMADMLSDGLVAQFPGRFR